MVEHITGCEDVWGEISNYIDGEVDAARRSSMEEHFKSCARCASVLAGTKNVVALYGDERMLEVPAGFGRRLEKRLAKGAAGTSGWSSMSAWLVPLAAMVLIAGGMMLTSSLTHGHFLKSHHAEPATNIPPDLVVVVSSGAKLFHVAGCPFIHDKASERTLTAKEAMQEGYMPCTRCLRQYLKTSVTRTPGESVAEASADRDVDLDHDEDHEEVLSLAGH
jgi:Putative zinc-finger